jgi:hypothetical protein
MKAPHTFGDIAGLIASGAPAKWLESTLEELSVEVMNDIRLHAVLYPRPSDVRCRTEFLRESAIQFKEAFNGLSEIRWRLPSTKDLKYIRVAKRAADKIIELCDLTLEINPVKPGAPSQQGRVMCAVIVVEAWAAVRGRLPGANNLDAQDACDRYWNACGCEPIRKDKPADWNWSIAAARRERTSPRYFWIGSQIRRVAAGW